MKHKQNAKKKRNLFLSIAFVLGLTCLFSLYYKSTYQNKTYTETTPVKSYSSINNTSGELHGIWIAFLDYNSNGYSKTDFVKFVNNTFDTCVANNYDTVFVHVRMFADAMYNSKYFPWSKYASGKQGKNPGYDPLSIMVKEAHKRNLKIHAWINPYRITSGTTSYKNISKSSYAYKWSHSSSASKKRNVLKYNGSLYFNPAKQDVINLISNGVKEIVQKYNVDGIHFDDYFYPGLGSKYKKLFDSKEYKSYNKSMKKAGKSPLGIVKWRRENVNKLIRNVYSTVKKSRKNCIFGISPAGYLNNLYDESSYYCDVKKWMDSDKYIDYICPQIYWSFENKTAPYKKICQEWINIPRNSDIKLYIGLAAYKAGMTKKEAKANGDMGWYKSKTVLKREVIYARNTQKVDGFIVFDYGDINRKAARTEMNNLKKVFEN